MGKVFLTTFRVNCDLLEAVPFGQWSIKVCVCGL